MGLCSSTGARTGESVPTVDNPLDDEKQTPQPQTKEVVVEMKEDELSRTPSVVWANDDKEEIPVSNFFLKVLQIKIKSRSLTIFFEIDIFFDASLFLSWYMLLLLFSFLFLRR